MSDRNEHVEDATVVVSKPFSKASIVATAVLLGVIVVVLFAYYMNNDSSEKRQVAKKSPAVTAAVTTEAKPVYKAPDPVYSIENREDGEQDLDEDLQKGNVKEDDADSYK